MCNHKFYSMRKLCLLIVLSIFAGVSPYTASAISSGTYTVGTGGDFPDLAAAVADLNSSTLTGPVVFKILNGSYSGSDWQITIGDINGAGSTNTVTIQPDAGADVKISVSGSSSDNYVIQLDDAEFVTIQNITLENTSSSNGRVIEMKGTASNNTVKGCTLSTSSSGTASSAARAVVYMAESFTGSSNVIQNNTIKNGHSGIYINGGSSSADDNIIYGNTITGSKTYFIYAANTGNLNVMENNATGTSCKYGLYFSYTKSGEIADNTVSINATSGAHYGMYNDYVNVSSTDITEITGNNISVTCKGSSSGEAWSLYNNNSNYLLINDNKFEATIDKGHAFTPSIAYGGKEITATGNIFNVTATTGGINDVNDYRFIHNASSSSANNITVRGNEFNYKSTSGTIGYSSTSYFMYYPNSCVMSNNEFNITRSSSGTMYGLSGYHFVYQGKHTRVDSNEFNVSYASGGTIYNLFYYYGYYYGNDNSFSNNTITITSKNATTYSMGRYFSYRGERFTANGNTVTVTNTSKSGSIYSPYYLAYYVSDGNYHNNNFTINSGSGSIYSPYMLKGYTSSTEVSNNTFNINATSATINAPYYNNYNASGGRTHHNTFNIEATSGTTYAPYYTNAYSNNDTVEENTWNVTNKSGTIYVYNYYLNSLTRNNKWEIKNQSGSSQFYFRYPQGGSFENNSINITSTTGTIYGAYTYGGSASYSLNLTNNKFNLKSNSGTVYGLYNYYYPGKYKFMGNQFLTSTSGSSYLYSNTTGYYGEQMLFNNTFHSNSTGSVNQLFRQTGGSESYPGKMFMYNNIFSRTEAAGGNDIDVSDTAYFVSDYNLFYTPDATTMKLSSLSVTTSDFFEWKTSTGQDMSSIMHNPGYMDAANGDLRPDPASPNSWAVQGRGVHIEDDTMDILGTPRPRDRFEGVPDIGAYEVTPTSTPPNAVAIPSNPVANSSQKFVFGGDTIGTIEWGNTVPPSITVKQYTGIKASVTPGITERAFFFVDVQTPIGVYEYRPFIRYKDHWIGDISNETNTRIAKSSNGGAWLGYNYHYGVTDSIKNILMPAQDFDSLSSKFTAVENARIGIRCLVPPFGLHHYDVLADQAKESWEPVFSPIGYQAIVDSVESPLDLSKIFFISQPSGGALPVYPMQNLVENTTYYVNVRTICGVNDTSSWSVDSFRTMITCHAPNIRHTDVTFKSAVIHWDTVQTAIEYEYAIDKSPDNPPYGTNIKDNFRLATALQPGTTYYVHVRSHCSTVYDISGWGLDSFTTKWPANIAGIGSSTGLSVYPNPVKDVLHINIPGNSSEKAVLAITDITGKTVHRAEVTAGETTVNLQHLPAGVYTLKYSNRDKTEVIKITKE